MEVSKLAKQMLAEGKEVFNLSVGDTHFPMSDFLQSKVLEACQKEYTHYDKALGLDILKDSISADYEIDPDKVVISNGVKNVLYSFLLSQSGKKVAILEPAWLGYKAICFLTNCETVSIDTQSPNWLDQLSQTSYDILLVCSPNNPDGNVLTKLETDIIIEDSKTKNALVVLDEIYKEYIYEGRHHFEDHYNTEHLIILNGFSKSHAVTGLRIGYGIFSNPDHVQLINKVQQNTFTCPNTISQYALSFAKDNQSKSTEYKEYYKENRDLISQLCPQLIEFKPQGGFYYFANLKALGIQVNGEAFCKKLLEHTGIAMIPGKAYGDKYDDFIRLSFCIDRSVLEKGILKFTEYLKKHE